MKISNSLVTTNLLNIQRFNSANGLIFVFNLNYGYKTECYLIMQTFLLKHAVDLSLLTNGFKIQTEFHQLVYALPGGVLHHGENREIKVLIDGEEFTTKLYNIGFDKVKYPDHPDLLQVRYSPNSPIAKKLQSIFAEDYQYLLAARQIAGPRRQIRLPEDNYDEIVFSGTSMANVFILNCIKNEDREQVSTEIQQMSELEFETIELREDKNASIKEINRLQRVRILDRSIGDSLKQLYDFRCQMTGEKIGEPYGAIVVEAHHIIPFTESMNNDTSNIIILSPNYHRIIHKTKASFNREELAFIFPNGLTEKVKLDKHLSK